MIRSAWAKGETQLSLAKQYGISAPQVCRIVNGVHRGKAIAPTGFPSGNVLEVVGWDGYLISDQGKLYSCRTNGKPHPGRWKQIRANPNKDGYPEVKLWRGGKSKTVRVHTLVLTAFVGPCPEGMEACHENGVRLDCVASNLRWGTDKDNTNDRDRHGRTAKGERSGVAKLTEQKVLEARSLYAAGWSQQRIANHLGISKRQAGRVAKCQQWKHLEKPKEQS